MLEQVHFLLIYGITLLISMITYKKYFNTILKYLPIIIVYTLLNELLGYFIRYTDYFSFFSISEYNKANDIIYNIYDIVFFGFFYYVFWKVLKSKKSKNWILFGSVISLAAYIVSTIFQNPFLVSLYYANAISCWILFCFTLLYFFQLKEKWDWKIQQHNLMLWISIGLAVFHLFFPFVFTTAYFNYDIWQTYHLQSILKFLIVIMYSFFCVGFILCRQKAFEH